MFAVVAVEDVEGIGGVANAVELHGIELAVMWHRACWHTDTPFRRGVAVLAPKSLVAGEAVSQRVAVDGGEDCGVRVVVVGREGEGVIVVAALPVEETVALVGGGPNGGGGI